MVLVLKATGREKCDGEVGLETGGGDLTGGTRWNGLEGVMGDLALDEINFACDDASFNKGAEGLFTPDGLVVFGGGLAGAGTPGPLGFFGGLPLRLGAGGTGGDVTPGVDDCAAAVAWLAVAAVAVMETVLCCCCECGTPIAVETDCFCFCCCCV